MRNWAIAFAVLALASCQSSTEEAPPPDESTGSTSEEFIDPVSAAPEMYSLELENDFVKVLRERAEGNAPMHSHGDRVSVYLTDVSATVTQPGGETMEASREANSVTWGDATTHSSVLESPVELVTIELKDLEGEQIPLSDVDATKTDLEHHVVELENERVRVLRMTYPAGTTSPVHTHRPGAMVVLQGGKSRNIPEGGEPEEAGEAVRGQVVWSEGTPPHATENVGDTDIVVIRVELKKRPVTTS